VTLRAWERRYGIPAPQRTGQGYRLYTDMDVKTLRWLKEKVDTGLSIGRAVDYLSELQRTGRDPALENLPQAWTPLSTVYFSGQVVAALAGFNEAAANDALRQAFSLYSVDQVLSEVVQPALVEIGERWQRGELPVAAEHFATQFCIQHLMSMSAAAAASWRPGLILAGCLPGETHEVGLLILVLMLRWRGWNVKYLGPDLSLERLDEVLLALTPQMILFGATRPENTRGVAQVVDLLGRFRHPPQIIFGGQAFEDRDPAGLPGAVLKGMPGKIVLEIERRLQTTG
jgi:methanogenic corrinoid protein MtbC1